MINRVIKSIMALVGLAIGFGLYMSLSAKFPETLAATGIYSLINPIVSGVLLGIIFYLISPWVLNEGKKTANWVEGEISKVPPFEIFISSIGLIFGLIIAYLVSGLLSEITIPFVGVILSVMVYIFMGYIGINIARRNKDELFKFPDILKTTALSSSKEKSSDQKGKKNCTCPKILDTSVIIDGRIADICKTGFIEGTLVIPEFVLEELRHIADSSDDLKRVRGRRGLDILNIIQKELEIDVMIYEKDIKDVAEVDVKLLKLAQIMNGKVVTNDFNLNKVAQFQGVEVLNINELANAVKPVVIPGEEMVLQVVKEGKEHGQGLAYLDDGTMIVVDTGKKYMGETITAVVTSVLQTAAGRMIFARPKNER
ncbi:PIN/TRAM domain-containing protein [Peptostreptococcaceae bacterium AGR-M142]